MSADHKGMPSGLNKSEGTGIPHKMKGKDLEKDKELTRKFTEGDEEISDTVQHNNPNRNVDKTSTDNASYTSND